MSEQKKPITVGELIALLQARPPQEMDLPVILEGCDCHGRALGVHVQPADTWKDRFGVQHSSEAYLLITRTDGEHQ